MGQYEVHYMLTKRHKKLPIGAKVCSVTAANWLQAVHIVKMQYGGGFACFIDIEQVLSYPGTSEIQVIMWSRYRNIEARMVDSFVEAS